MKTRVLVRMVAETFVEIEVEHDDANDPTELSPDDCKRAHRAAREVCPNPDWVIDHVEES